jgi:uroporphyrinogen III methyltransferase/synthase
LREKLRWFELRPLFGKRILVTRAREQASELVALLQTLGAEPVELPVIRILPAQDTAPLDEALHRRYDWIIFTSVNGVEAVWSRLNALRRDARAWGQTRLCAIGPATAEKLAAHGLRADLVPAEYVAEAILAEIGDVAGQRILLPRADLARAALAEGLRQKGAHVDEVTAYHTVTADTTGPQAQTVKTLLAEGRLDAITLTSSSTVRGFAQFLHSLPPGPLPALACIGPITARTARELGLPVTLVANEYTIKGLVLALTHHFQPPAREAV